MIECCNEPARDVVVVDSHADGGRKGQTEDG